MMGLLTPITDLLTAAGAALTQPIKDVLIRKEERKQAHNAAVSAQVMADANNATTVEIEKTHLDAIMQGQLDKTWKDDFVTYAVVGIIPAVIVGGILAGFGFPLFLEGVLKGVTVLSALIPLGNIMTVVVSAAVGFSTLKRLF
jgi:hypothetical protein